jgi:pimeloyl-ACP methyl ester carboxylesterase
MKTHRFFLIVALFVTLFSCRKTDEPSGERTLWLRHKGAEMPIWVRGNASSNKIILFLHGGPGDCAMCYRPFLKSLENTAVVAYWDQRIAGSSTGKVDPKTLTYAQFGEDATLVVRLLREQYPDAKIYLLAHSFGVELAWQFLTTGDNQRLVSGLMAVNGTFSTYRWLYQIREWGLRQARLQQKPEMERYLLDHPVTRENLLSYDWARLERTVHELGANPISVMSDKKFVIEYLFASPNTALAQFGHPKQYGDWARNEMLRFEKSTQLTNIRIPVGLFWGVKDGIIPLEIADETKALLTSAQTTTVHFEESWHEPFITETAKFAEAVRRFVK